MDALAMPWANARVAHLLAVHRMMPMEVGDGQEEKIDMNDDDQLMYTQKVETIEPFPSHIVPVKTGRGYVGEHINVMVQALQTQDGSLPQGLTVQNTYTKLRKGSKKAVVVVQNHTTYLQTLWKKTPVARTVAALPVPGLPKGEQVQEGADKSHNSHTFADYTKDFLLKMYASKERLGAVFSQKQADGQFHLVAYGSQALTAHEKNYYSTKLEFLALKWAITEHFKEYLLYQPFLVKTNNNSLTCIMTTPNLDATGH